MTMYELMTSDDGGRTWTPRAEFTDIGMAQDAMRAAWVWHELAAVFEDGEIVAEYPRPRGQIDGELPRWPVAF
jgi:hypothetical protein